MTPKRKVVGYVLAAAVCLLLLAGGMAWTVRSLRNAGERMRASSRTIDLPKVSRAPVSALPPVQVVITVSKDRQYTVNSKQVADISELSRIVDAVRSPGRKCEIVIRSDKDVMYREILPALDQVSQLPDVTITLAYAPPEAK